METHLSTDSSSGNSNAGNSNAEQRVLSASLIPLRIVDRALEQFSETLAFQEELLQAKGLDRSLEDTLILVEHPAIYTQGRGSEQQIPADPDLQSIPWTEIRRGGQA